MRLFLVCRGTIEVINPNGDNTGGGPFARGRARASLMGVWRTPKGEEYANPQGLVGRKVRVYFDGDCTFFEAKVNLHSVNCSASLINQLPLELRRG